MFNSPNVRAGLVAAVIMLAAAVFAWFSVVDPTQPEPLGAPAPWQFNWSKPASPLQAGLYHLHTYIFVASVAITAFVAILITIVAFRFRESANPVPARLTHNTMLEILWTVVPVLILISIAIPTLRLLAVTALVPANAAFAVKATGRQWYWDYEYPDHGGFTFSSTMEQDAAKLRETGAPRLLGVDNPLVIPVGVPIRLQVTAGDVDHAFAVPALGVKKDAIPGRLNEIWLQADRPGTYYTKGRNF